MTHVHPVIWGHVKRAALQLIDFDAQRCEVCMERRAKWKLVHRLGDAWSKSETFIACHRCSAIEASNPRVISVEQLP